MTVGTTQLYDVGILNLLANAQAKWDNGAANYAFILLDNAYTPSDAHASYSAVSANECGDADYAPIAVGSRTLTNTSGTIYADSADANFGSSVTIAARYLVCVAGNPASLQAADPLVFYQDLRTEDDGNVASTNSNFVVSAPTNGWFSLAQA